MVAAALLLILINIVCLNLFENITVWVCFGVTVALLLLVIPLFPYTVRYKKIEK